MKDSLHVHRKEEFMNILELLRIYKMSNWKLI
jgi:hypothetical protein